MTRHIAPSILAADFGNLEDEIKMINNSNASWIHCDIMDGVYVPNISFGIPVVETVSKISEKPLDVHLMIVNPERYIHDFHKAGANNLTIHFEACKHINRAICEIKELGMTAGVSLNPGTPVSFLNEIISDVDLVLIMTVNPGFGGQDFIERSYSKIEETKELITKKNSKALIQVDGGVALNNAKKLFDTGVNILVAGTTVFKATDPVAIIDQLLQV